MDWIKRIKIFLLNLKSFLAIYALVDLIFMSVLVFRFIEEAVASEVNIIGPAPLLFTPFLLFIACIGVRIDKVWSDLSAMIASGWLIKRVLHLWVNIANFREHPILSWSTLEDWWRYERIGRWEIPRLILTIFVFVYSAFLMTRHLKRLYTSIDKKTSSPYSNN